MEITYASPSNSDFQDGSSMPTSTRPVKIIPLQHPSTTASTASSVTGAFFSRWILKLQRMTWLEWLELFLPCSRWIRTYNWREYFKVDLMAGVTVGIMLVPQVIYARVLTHTHMCIYITYEFIYIYISLYVTSEYIYIYVIF